MKTMAMHISFFGVLIFLSLGLRAQSIQQDPYTGSASFQIPIGSVQSGSLSHQVSLNYHTSGIKPGSGNGIVGLGWNLQAGGQIVRELRGLPDDLRGTSEILKRGWLADTAFIRNENVLDPPNVAREVGNFSSSAASELGACDASSATYEALYSLGGYDTTRLIKDTEPDIFHIRAPGLNAKFVFDNNGNIQPLGLARFSVEIDTVTLELEQFVVTNERGTKYYFDKVEYADLQTVADDENDVQFFKWDYFAYRDKITYAYVWHLTRVVSITGSEINFAYEGNVTIPYDQDGIGGSVIFNEAPYSAVNDTISVFLYNPATGDFEEKVQYIAQRSFTSFYRLKSISGSDSRIDFINDGILIPYGEYELRRNVTNQIDIYDLKNEGRLLRRFKLDLFPTRGPRGSVDGGDPNYHLIYLKSISEGSSVRLLPAYEFEYYGVNWENQVSGFSGDTEPPTDYFGYKVDQEVASASLQKLYVYPELSDANRYRTEPIANYTGSMIVLDGNSNLTSSLNSVSTGSLKKVTFPTGGSQTVTYGLKEYYDEVTQTNTYGGGIRVASIRTHDGVSHDNDLMTNYAYTDAGGNSTGKLLYQPSHVSYVPFHRDPQTGVVLSYDSLVALGFSESEILKRTAVRTEWDMTSNAHPGANVVYASSSKVTADVGTALYEFDVPATYNSTQEVLLEPGVKLARDVTASMSSLNCKPLGPMPISFLGFAAQVGEDYRYNGLLKKKSDFDTQDRLVREVENTYDTLAIQGYGSVKALRTSSYPTEVSYLDGGNPVETELATYFFQEYNLPLKEVKRIASTTEKNYDAESGSYLSSTSTFEYDTATHGYLKKQSTTGVDGITHTTSYSYPEDYAIANEASDEFTISIEQMKAFHMLRSPIEVVQTRTESGVEKVTGASLTKFKHQRGKAVLPLQTYALKIGSAIDDFSSTYVDNTGGTSVLVHDGRYENTQTFLSYNYKNNLESAESRSGYKTGIHYHLGDEVVLTIDNALAEEVVYADFESTTGHSFETSNSASVTGRVDGLGHSLVVSETLSASLIKGDEEYLFSCWINTSNSGTITITVQDENTVSVQGTIAFASTNSAYEYYEGLIDVSTLSDSLEVVVSSNATISIDDAALYPESASIGYSTRVGTETSTTVAATNSAGQTATVLYDDLGRVLHTKDQDDNIVSAYDYHYNEKLDFSVSVTGTGTVYLNESNEFTIHPQIEGATYRHVLVDQDEDATDFSGVSWSSDPTFSKTFNDPDKTYKLNVQINYLGATKESSSTLKVQPVERPLELKICHNRPLLIDLCEENPPLLEPCTGSPSSLENTGSSLTLQAVVSGGSGSGTHQYQWYKGYKNVVLANGEPIPDQLVGSTEIITVTDYHNYRFYCKVDSAAVSPEILFETFTSDPNCTIPNQQ